MPLYEIEALRSDGLNCGGTIEAENIIEATHECRRTFRKFSPKNGIVCPIHRTDSKACYLHRGEVFTFSNHTVKAVQS